MAGRASIELKGRELGFDLAGRSELLGRVTDRVKDAEANGYTYEAADASFELLLVEEIDGERPQYFRVESWRTIVERSGSRGTPATAEATVKLHAGGERHVSTGEGNGPVNALDHALRQALIKVYPELEALRAHRLQGPHPRLDARHGRGDARAHRDQRRADRVEHRRRRPEPAGGRLGGAHRLGHLGVAQPRRRAALSASAARSAAAA